VTAARRGFVRKLAIPAGFALSIVCCIKWVDRPAALWAHDHVHYRAVFIAMTYLMYLVMAWVCLCFGKYGADAFLFERESLKLGTVFGTSLAVAAAVTLSTSLKVVFGRSGPESFQGNPSWISAGIYGFFPFRNHMTYFPSEHTAVVTAFAAVLWHRVPALRFLSLALIAAVIVGLYAANGHWISDIIAGLGLGLLCGKGTVILLGWNSATVETE
jgi:membrane-associated phospholipid phosphatase